MIARKGEHPAISDALEEKDAFQQKKPAQVPENALGESTDKIRFGVFHSSKQLSS
jgi:hypothetical protein